MLCFQPMSLYEAQQLRDKIKDQLKDPKICRILLDDLYQWTDGYTKDYGNYVHPDYATTYDFELLDRLVSDCKYFLGYGNKCVKHLWAGDIDKHISEMRRLQKICKPDWLTVEQIDEYEKQMKE